MLVTKARIIEQKKKRDQQRARKLQLLATWPKVKPLSALVREKRKRRLLFKISRSSKVKVGGRVAVDDEDAELGGGDRGDPRFRAAVRVTAGGGGIRIRIQEFVSSVYL